jgi:hypothetical protein
LRLFFPAAFAFAQRAFAVAAIFARPAALIFRRFFGATVAFAPFTFAHLARCAAAMAALAALDIFLLPEAFLDVAPPAKIAASWDSILSMSSLREMAFRNCTTVRVCSASIVGSKFPLACSDRQEKYA